MLGMDLDYVSTVFDQLMGVHMLHSCASPASSSSRRIVDKYVGASTHGREDRWFGKVFFSRRMTVFADAQKENHLPHESSITSLASSV